MGSEMVAYGVRSGEVMEAAQERVRRAWAKDHGKGLLLWRWEGSTMASQRVEERTRLHQVIFCIRADFAGALFLPSREVLRDPWSFALVCAEVWSVGGTVIVNGDLVERDEADSLQRLAGAWAALGVQVDPRQANPTDDDTPADIGGYTGMWETGRLARKLRDDFEFTDQRIADFLEATDYPAPKGNWYSASGVNTLLRGTDRGVEVQTVLTPGSLDDIYRAMVTFGQDAPSLLEEAKAFNAALNQPYAGVLTMTEVGGLPASMDPVADLCERPRLVTLLSVLSIIGAVYVSSEDSFGSTLEERAIIYAYLRRAGVKVIVNGHRIETEWQGEAATLQSAADSSVRLHAVLRAHDANSVRDNRLSIDSARAFAQTRRTELDQVTFDLIAHGLNKEGFTTRRRVGRWYASSARDLIESN